MLHLFKMSNKYHFLLKIFKVYTTIDGAYIILKLFEYEYFLILLENRINFFGKIVSFGNMREGGI